MGTLQLQDKILGILILITFWTSAVFIPSVSTYWAWWRHWYGKAAIAIDVLLTGVLLPSALRLMFHINIASVDYGWFTIMVFALIPVRTVWLAVTIWQIQREERSATVLTQEAQHAQDVRR
jgi:hypothetical protein